VTGPADLGNPLVLSERRRIAAPASVIFGVLRDPRRHREFDSSGMVRTTDAPPITAVGDAFVMSMHNDMFGDYEMRSEVVEYEPDRAIAWAPKRYDVVEDSWDHRWGWRLAPDGEATEVTAFFDCSRLPKDGLLQLRNGEMWRPVLEHSLEKLETLVVP
jgi:uncharacterized protein YndB with AHSA1/START domain